MALLGIQLVLTMVVASFLQKIMPTMMSFAQWLLCSGLVRYLHPTDEELKSLTLGAMASNGNRGHKKRYDRRSNQQTNQQHQPFNVPKNIDIQLDTARIQAYDVLQLYYFSDFQWLVDFSLCSLFIYFATELYYAFMQPVGDFNISMLWCFMVLLFSFKILIVLCIQYFRLPDSGEMILILTSGFFYLILAMGVLIIDEEKLDLKLLPAYDNFTSNARIFMETQGVQSQGPISLTTFRIILVVICSIIGALLTFPGLRYAKMYTDALKYATEDPPLRFILYVNFLFPVVILILWIKPYVKDFLTLPNRYRRVPYMALDDFEAMKLILLVSFCFLRLCLLRTHLQAHLNLAYERIQRLKKEAGKISSLEYQRMITRVFYFLCFAALQYIAPLLCIAFMTFMLKTMGNLSWAPFVELPTYSTNITTTNTTSGVFNRTDLPEGVRETAAQLTLTFANLKNVFNQHWFAGILSFFCWWTTGMWFIASLFGVVYHSYFQT